MENVEDASKTVLAEKAKKIMHKTKIIGISGYIISATCLVLALISSAYVGRVMLYPLVIISFIFSVVLLDSSKKIKFALATGNIRDSLLSLKKLKKFFWVTLIVIIALFIIGVCLYFLLVETAGDVLKSMG